ncbi:MAG: hypothetical protein ORN21_06415, partial [Methylophilaceae bacterium]|nr:hypothetical protein [Methylophilaceae bacterium]
SATQEALPSNRREPPSRAPQSRSPVQTVLQKSRNATKGKKKEITRDSDGVANLLVQLEGVAKANKVKKPVLIRAIAKLTRSGLKFLDSLVIKIHGNDMKKIILLCLLLVGCATTDVQKYSAIDTKDKSITVPVGSEGLKGKLKQWLITDGWKLFVDKGPQVIQGEANEKFKLEKYDTFNTRYRLLVKSNWLGICLNGTNYVVYDLSVVDNKTGAEAFTMSGDDCESQILEKFKQSFYAN